MAKGKKGPRKLKTEDVVVCALGRDFYGYFGWPTVGAMEDGTLVAVASGMRTAHVCPYGRTVFLKSHDQGRTWTSPRVINDSPLDDRDAGVISPGGKRLLVTWFSSDTRYYAGRRDKKDPWQQAIAAGLRWMTDENARRFVGSWLRLSDDGGDTWSHSVRVPVNSPHGPIRLRSGELLYLGKVFDDDMKRFCTGVGEMVAVKSSDGGVTWTHMGTVPIHPGTVLENYHEAHVAELPSGKLIGHIRFQSHGDSDVSKVGLVSFSIMQTESTDGGRTWSPVETLGFHGSPPHLLMHSSGALVCVYGYRQEPYGERACISRNEGKTWKHCVLRDDGPDGDLGYPSSVELSDGRIFTLFYQKPSSSEEKCALLGSIWRVPK